MVGASGALRGLAIPWGLLSRIGSSALNAHEIVRRINCGFISPRDPFSDSSNGAGLNWFLARSRIYKSFLNMFALNSFTTVFFFYLTFCVLLARVKNLHGNSLRGKNIASRIFCFFQESDFKIHFTQMLFCLNLPCNVLLFLPFPCGE